MHADLAAEVWAEALCDELVDHHVRRALVQRAARERDGEHENCCSHRDLREQTIGNVRLLHAPRNTRTRRRHSRCSQIAQISDDKTVTKCVAASDDL